MEAEEILLLEAKVRWFSQTYHIENHDGRPERFEDCGWDTCKKHLALCSPNTQESNQ